MPLATRHQIIANFADSVIIIRYDHFAFSGTTPAQHQLPGALFAPDRSGSPLDQLVFWQGQNPAITEPIDQIVFAVTSANQENARYNPIPLSRAGYWRRPLCPGVGERL
ncbi:MAG: hypothetical protein M5U34_30665 [Chloroflexi bacterium]|nr:hypothetical protein [Chloroflexota bacterium]